MSKNKNISKKQGLFHKSEAILENTGFFVKILSNMLIISRVL